LPAAGSPTPGEPPLVVVPVSVPVEPVPVVGVVVVPVVVVSMVEVVLVVELVEPTVTVVVSSRVDRPATQPVKAETAIRPSTIRITSASAPASVQRASVCPPCGRSSLIVGRQTGNLTLPADDLQSLIDDGCFEGPSSVTPASRSSPFAEKGGVDGGKSDI
jgi:hypothetical protein